MAVPVALGKTFFDTTALREEHTRLSRTLIKPSPRLANDQAESLFFAIKNSSGEVTERYDLYFKSFYDKEGDAPSLKLFFKDGSNVEREFHGNAASDARTLVGGTDTLEINGVAYDHATDSTAIDSAAGTITSAGSVVGSIHYDAVSGLDLAMTNTRISEVSTALDGLSKMLTVLTGNIDAGISLIR